MSGNGGSAACRGLKCPAQAGETSKDKGENKCKMNNSRDVAKSMFRVVTELTEVQFFPGN